MRNDLAIIEVLPMALVRTIRLQWIAVIHFVEIVDMEGLVKSDRRGQTWTRRSLDARAMTAESYCGCMDTLLDCGIQVVVRHLLLLPWV
jgi:hypothetical protein